jgi:ATP-dependent protease HslVU (ClpYQ) peptidase subunit
MTAIVAIKDETGVHLGADSLVTCAYTASEKVEPKICRVGELLVGCAGDCRAADVFSGMVLPSRVEGETDYQYLTGRFVGTLQTVLEKGGCLREVRGGSYRWDCQILVALRGNLFSIGIGFAVCERPAFTAIGSGKEVALGSLHTTGLYDIPTRERLRLALRAAADQTPYVSAPFVFARQANVI